MPHLTSTTTLLEHNVNSGFTPHYVICSDYCVCLNSLKCAKVRKNKVPSQPNNAVTKRQSNTLYLTF